MPKATSLGTVSMETIGPRFSKNVRIFDKSELRQVHYSWKSLEVYWLLKVGISFFGRQSSFAVFTWHKPRQTSLGLHSIRPELAHLYVFTPQSIPAHQPRNRCHRHNWSHRASLPPAGALASSGPRPVVVTVNLGRPVPSLSVVAVNSGRLSVVWWSHDIRWCHITWYDVLLRYVIWHHITQKFNTYVVFDPR